jgi:NAD(P)-dependent dehydrogenase (short-subunit alcohol dehydrogenase family)
MNQDQDIAGKVVLVTGASSGIGAHAARMLAARGARVAAAARRADLLKQFAQETRAAGGSMLAVPMDLASLDSIRAGVARIEAELGPVEILLNNAGVLVEGKALDVQEQDFDQLLSINVKGTFFVTQACGQRMIELGLKGKVVTIASAAGLVCMPMLAAYGMSKAALVHMTKSLAREWARHGICVNAISPGFVATEMNEGFFASPAGHRMIERLPRKRVASVQDLDALLLLLMSERASSFINGAVIPVDDGFAVS